MPELEDDLIEGYPARFQIPPSTLNGLDHEEKVRRAERFAMASLLYEIMTGRKPFEGLTDDEVRHSFMNGDFPDDAAALPNSLFIFSGWSAEFSQELTRRGMPARKRFSKLLTVHSETTRCHSFPSYEKLCQSPSSAHWSSSSGHYCLCTIILRGARSRSYRVHGCGAGGQLCSSSLASIDWSSQGWQSLFLVSEGSNGRRGFGRYPSCWYGWNGACKCGRASGAVGDIQTGFPYPKPTRVTL